MYLFFDCETSGFCPWRSDIISICFIVTDAKFNELDRTIIFSRPDVGGWSVEAQKVHKIKLTDALAFDERKIACAKILLFFKKNGIIRETVTGIIHSHIQRFFDDKKNQWNTPYFDFWFLFAMFWKEEKVFDLRHFIDIECMKSLYPLLKSYGLEKRTLDEACRVSGYSLMNHHNAEADTDALIHCWQFFTSMNTINGNVQSKQIQSETLNQVGSQLEFSGGARLL